MNSDKELIETTQIVDLSKVEFHQICRGCLSEGDLKSIYSKMENLDGVLLAEMFMECTSIIISESDGLPTHLCDNCVLQINQSYLFKKQCQRIDESLHSYLYENQENEQKLAFSIKSNSQKNIEIDDVKIESEHSFSNDVESDDSVPSANNDIKIRDEKKKTIATKSKRTNVSRERKFTCEVCAKTFLTASHLRTHMMIHSQEKPFMCDVCYRPFNSKPNLKRHIMTHTGERPFRCDVCGKGFIQAVTLTDHMRVHTNEAPYLCSHCERTFKQAGELRRHMKKYHDPNNVNENLPRRRAAAKDSSGKKSEKRKYRQYGKKTFLCCNCGKSFASKTLLEIHNRIHTGEKPYTCSICNKSFSQVSTLKTHMLVHTGEKKYDCSVCKKSFRHRIALKQHLLIHMGIRKYACTFCPKMFTQSSQLNYHLRTHTGEKPYTCSVCGKNFALKGNLTVHVRTHTGETPYICAVCGKGFYDSSSMKKHQRGHGENR